MKTIIIMCIVLSNVFSEVFMKLLNADYYSSIIRTSLKSVNLISLYPQGWLTKAIKSTTITGKQFSQGSQVREIIFIPSLFTLRECDEYGSSIDDEHFCSKLCEKGFVVHILDPVRKGSCDYTINAQCDWNYLLYSVKEVVQWRTKEAQSLPGRCIAVIASEISVGPLLNYMSEVALPMSPSRVDIGAVVVIDPVPINYLHSTYSRQRILNKYVLPLADALRWQKATGKMKKTTSSGSTLATMENIHNRNFLKRIKSKGLMGEYLIGLAESAVEPKSAVISMENPDSSGALSFEEEINFYEDAISKQMRESIVERRTHSKSGQKHHFSGLDKAVAEDAVTDKTILGSFPPRSSEMAQAMKDRILVLSCEDHGDEERKSDWDETDSGSEFPASSGPPLLWEDSLLSEGSGGVWDAQAVEELAQLYQATPVIHIPCAAAADDEDNADEEDDNEGLIRQDRLGPPPSDGLVWTIEDRRRHNKLAQAIADWLHMLAAFNYL